MPIKDEDEEFKKMEKHCEEKIFSREWEVMEATEKKRNKKSDYFFSEKKETKKVILFSQERKVREAAVGETVSWILDQLDGGTQE